MSSQPDPLPDAVLYEIEAARNHTKHGRRDRRHNAIIPHVPALVREARRARELEKWMRWVVANSSETLFRQYLELALRGEPCPE